MRCILAPPHHFVVPSPYKQGESAVRINIPHGSCTLYSVLCTLKSGSCTLYSVSCTLLRPFPQKVEHVKEFVLCGMLIEADVSDIVEEGKVNDTTHILLVVRHIGVELLVLLTGEVKFAVVLIDILNRLAHSVGGES